MSHIIDMEFKTNALYYTKFPMNDISWNLRNSKFTEVFKFEIEIPIKEIVY